jgi:hypothetical protein
MSAHRRKTDPDGPTPSSSRFHHCPPSGSAKAKVSATLLEPSEPGAGGQTGIRICAESTTSHRHGRVHTGSVPGIYATRHSTGRVSGCLMTGVMQCGDAFEPDDVRFQVSAALADPLGATREWEVHARHLPALLGYTCTDTDPTTGDTVDPDCPVHGGNAGRGGWRRQNAMRTASTTSSERM